MVKTTTLMCGTLIPVMRAAFGLLPTAYTFLPNLVEVEMYTNRTVTAIRIRPTLGTVNSFPFPKS